MLNNIFVVLAQEISEREKGKQQTFNIVDPDALGADKVRSITLFLSGQQSKQEEEIAGKFDIGIFWTESWKKVYESSLVSSAEALEKFDSLKAQLKELESLATKGDPETEKKTKGFFEGLEAKEKRPPTESTPAPITTTQADYHGFFVHIIKEAKNYTIIGYGGQMYVIPKNSVKKKSQIQRDDNATLIEFDESTKTFYAKHDDGRGATINDPENVIKLAKTFGWDGADVDSAIGFLNLHIGEKFDGQDFFQ